MQIAQWVFRQALNGKRGLVTKEPHNAILQNGPHVTAILAADIKQVKGNFFLNETII